MGIQRISVLHCSLKGTSPLSPLLVLGTQIQRPSPSTFHHPQLGDSAAEAVGARYTRMPGELGSTGWIPEKTAHTKSMQHAEDIDANAK